LRPPFRVFLRNQGTDGRNLLLYCKPSSVSEYIAGSKESALVRSLVFSREEGLVVVTFDVATGSFVGGDESAVLSALSGNKDATDALSKASLEALASLDQSSAQLYAKKRDKVLVVGSGGREHALAVALARSPLVGQVLCSPGNGGTASEGGKISNVPNRRQDNTFIVDLVKSEGIEMVVVGPEAPLVAGLVDELAVQCPEVKAFGPSRAAAELEASKVSGLEP